MKIHHWRTLLEEFMGGNNLDEVNAHDKLERIGICSAFSQSTDQPFLRR